MKYLARLNLSFTLAAIGVTLVGTFLPMGYGYPVAIVGAVAAAAGAYGQSIGDRPYVVVVQEQDWKPIAGSINFAFDIPARTHGKGRYPDVVIETRTAEPGQWEEGLSDVHRSADGSVRVVFGSSSRQLTRLTIR